MSECINEKIEKWLVRAKEWHTKGNQLSVIKEQTVNLPHILTFLTELVEALKTFPSVADALHSLPEVGQLLGRLVLFPRLLLNRELHDALLTCMLSFFVEKPTCPVEERAKLWVKSQVKQLICKPDDELHKQLRAMSTGHEIRDFCNLYTEKVFDSVASSVTRQNATSADVSTLCDICYICLSLREIAAFDKLFTSSLHKLLTVVPKDDLVLKLTKDLEKTQEHPYSAHLAVVPLCYDGQVLLWSHSLHSLEHEVLDLTETTMKTSPLSAQNRLRSRHLVRACASYPHLYVVVFSILRDITEFCNYHWKLVSLVHTLHSLIREELASSNQLSHKLIACYPEPVQQLVNLLCFRPKDLSAVSLDNHIQLIDKSLQSCENSDEILREIHFTMVQFLDWYITIMSYSFICDKQVLLCCVRILLTFNGSTESPDVPNQAFQDVIECLRCLFSKLRLTTVDLYCALDSILVEEASLSEQRKVITDQLLSKVLLVFCVLSAGGHDVLEDILNMVCGKETSKRDQLEALLQTVIQVRQSGFSLLEINEKVKCWLISAVTSCSQSVCQSDDADFLCRVQELIR